MFVRHLVRWPFVDILVNFTEIVSNTRRVAVTEYIDFGPNERYLGNGTR